MWDQALQVLSDLGILPVIPLMAIAIAAIFIYRYFTDRG